MSGVEVSLLLFLSLALYLKGKKRKGFQEQWSHGGITAEAMLTEKS